MILLEICATKAPDVPIGLQKSMANLASTSFSDYFNMTPILEKPVTGNNNFILGYLDLQISISIYDIEVHLISLLKRYVKEKEELAKNLSSEDAYRLRNLNEYYIGYLERMGSPWEKYCNKSECLTFEIKGALPLLGDLLRQLQYYQQSQVPNIIVVAPDPKYTRILKEQGFGFIKYKDPNLVDCVLEYCGLKKFKFASIK